MMNTVSTNCTRGASLTAPGADLEISIVMPCLNEAETLSICIQKAKSALAAQGISGEIIIADNGSTDGSQKIAADLGARVINVPRKGYGAALQGGVAAALGKFVLMGDADDSYDFSHIGYFLGPLRDGDDLVMGNRFAGGIQPGAMPFLHRYLGNPVLTAIGRILFRSPVNDFHCGLRAFSKDAYNRMELRSQGMEFASEMVVRATLLGMRVSEVPTTLAKDGRSRAPHLRTWRDGWRHLRFLLLYSPRWLFLVPGLVMMALGLVAFGILWFGPAKIGRVTFDVDTMIFAGAAVLVGYQAVVFAIFARILGVTQGLLPANPTLERSFKHVNLELGVAAGASVTAVGVGVSIWAVMLWSRAGFGPLDASRMIRIVGAAVLLLTLGAETILSSFFMSILGYVKRP